MDLVCDTNIWYGIEAGNICPFDLKEMGHRLLALPFSISELTSKLDLNYFERRKRVAQTIIDHADEILPDVEHHLASIWQVSHPTDSNDWYLIIKALADAFDLDSLEIGVIDSENQKIVKIDITSATELRRDRDDDYIRSIEEQNEIILPGYTEARKLKDPIFLKKEKRELYKKYITNPYLQKIILESTYACAIGASDKKDIELPIVILEETFPKIFPFIRIQQFYMYDNATRKKPEANDRGDSKLFIYAQDGRCVFTKEKRWNRLAKEAGFEDLIFGLPSC